MSSKRNRDEENTSRKIVKRDEPEEENDDPQENDEEVASPEAILLEARQILDSVSGEEELDAYAEVSDIMANIINNGEVEGENLKEAMSLWLNACSNLSNLTQDDPEKAERFASEAVEVATQLSTILKDQPESKSNAITKADCLYHWAMAQMTLADIDIENSMKIAEEAIDRLKESLTCNPKNERVALFLIVTLKNKAERLQAMNVADLNALYQVRVEVLRLFEEISQYSEAPAELASDWAIALGEAASICPDKEEQKNQYSLSDEKFEESLKLSTNSDEAPDQLAVLCSWADCLNDRGSHLAHEKDALNVLQQASRKWEEALVVANTLDNEESKNQGIAEVRDGIGYCFMLQVPFIQDQTEKDKLIQESKKSLMEAQKLSKGISAYNLLCWNAKYGTEEECKQMLQMCIDLERLPSPWFVRSDKDLDSIREKPWFEKLIEQAVNNN